MDCLDLWAAKATMARRLERQPSWIELEALLHRVETTGQKRRLGRGVRPRGNVGRCLVALQHGRLWPSTQAR